MDSVFIDMKKLVSFLFLALLCCSAALAADLKTVNLSINSEDGIFNIGDKAVVKASVAKGEDPKMVMWVLENGAKILEKEIKLTTKPRVIYERVCDEPIAIQVHIRPADESNKDKAGIGFLAGPSEFRQGFPCPDDFKQFWDTQLARMRAAEPVVKMTPVALKGDDAAKFVCYALEVSMHEGRAARGYVAMPKDAAVKSLPIVMFFHGAGVARKSCRASVKTALSYAKMGPVGAIAADINAHGFYDDQPQQYYDDLENGELKDYRMIPPESKEGFYYRLMYLRDVRALDYLCTLPQWDGKHVMVTGSSQGGGQSCAVAGLDSRVTAFIPIVPGMSDEGAALVRKCGWTRHFRAMTDNPKVAKFYPYYDSANFVRFTTARMRMEVGLIDETCAPEGMFTIFNVSASPDKAIVPCPYRRHTISSSSNGYELWEQTIYKDRLKFIEEVLSE